MSPEPASKRETSVHQPRGGETLKGNGNSSSVTANTGSRSKLITIITGVPRG